MDAWQAIFRNLYTGFLLRDIFGKIVPGVVMLISYACLFRNPKRVFEILSGDLPAWTLLVIAGLAWTLTLGLQNIADDHLHIWRYFSEPDAVVAKMDIAPPSDLSLREKQFRTSTTMIDLFQRRASEV